MCHIEPLRSSLAISTKTMRAAIGPNDMARIAAKEYCSPLAPRSAKPLLYRALAPLSGFTSAAAASLKAGARQKDLKRSPLRASLARENRPPPHTQRKETNGPSNCIHAQCRILYAKQGCIYLRAADRPSSFVARISDWCALRRPPRRPVVALG
jgi:hypothetical protein